MNVTRGQETVIAKMIILDPNATLAFRISLEHIAEMTAAKVV
jgi:hypothetical protein